jgi:integral membrane sensor domain MASE1
VIAPHIYMAGKMTTTPPKYQPPPRRTYTDLGWICAALTGPATFLAVWIYCAITYGFLLGFGLGWIPALILALLVAVATIFLWPLAAVVLLYVIYSAFVIRPVIQDGGRSKCVVSSATKSASAAHIDRAAPLS